MSSIRTTFPASSLRGSVLSVSVNPTSSNTASGVPTARTGGSKLEDFRFVTRAAGSSGGSFCTATSTYVNARRHMGRDSMSVVDATLQVYGIQNLRIADGSIMPRVTTGNTMAPCIVIGERAGEILRAVYNI